ncbi:hypothetical protein HN51_035821, partial [Arachis hypogaea]
SYAPTAASWPKKKIQKEFNFLRFKQSSLVFHCERIEGGHTCQECKRKYIVKVPSGQSFESEPPAFDSKRILTSVKNSLDAFYRFSRPHTVIGTEDLFKLLGEKHQLYEFLDTFYMQCSYILFNKEHVKAILSEIVKHKAAENEQRIQSYMNMLVVVESPVDSALFPDRAPLSVLQKCEEFSSCCPVI